MKPKRVNKITDKMRLDWLQGKSVKVSWLENLILHLLVNENFQNLRHNIDFSIRQEKRGEK